jgi:choline-glycine betaine transporter
MKTAKYIKLRYIFYIFLGVWGIDLLTTFIALNFFNLVEANPIVSQLFSLGWYGWFISIFMTVFLLFFLTCIIGWFGKIIIKYEKKERDYRYYNFYLAYVCGIFSGFEITVIINNIRLILLNC